MPEQKIITCDVPSPLGDMIAGATADGLCFLEWHDRGGVDRITTRVEKRYKLPVSPGRNKHLDLLEKELAKYFAGKLKNFTTPLAVSGTAFERAVWQQLLAIPYGETRSYGQIAAALGKPGASRAVGRANGANYAAIIIPCHRVIDGDGKLHGYGGGLWRKKRLLELEGAVQPELQV